jgi:hypothetical protein
MFRGVVLLICLVASAALPVLAYRGQRRLRATRPPTVLGPNEMVATARFSPWRTR